MGVLEDISDIDSFITKDVKIVITGSKAWEQDNLIKVFNKLGILDCISFIFNFTPPAEEKNIIHNMGKFCVKTYFSNYNPDPFDPTNNEEIYHSIFKDFISEKSSKLEIVSTKKKSIFDIFKKRG